MEDFTGQKKHWSSWAVHLSILIPGVGFLVPLAFWFWQREGEIQARFQILQAFVYQMLQVVFWQVVLLVECILLVLLQIFNSLFHVPLPTQQMVLKAALVILTVIFLGFNLVYILLGVWAAIRVASGRTWSYPWVGEKILHSLVVGGNPDEDFENRLVAAMNHFGIFYGLSGLLVPFVTWIVTKEQSIKLRFQAVQALVIQAIAQVFLHGMGLLIGITASPVITFLVTIPSHDSDVLNGRWVMFFVVLLGILLFLTVLLHPLLAVLATIAGIRLLKNKEYDYPIIGKIIKKRMMGVSA